MLQAQRYLNRLLILDPENDEVFDLLQNMHTVRMKTHPIVILTGCVRFSSLIDGIWIVQ